MKDKLHAERGGGDVFPVLTFSLLCVVVFPFASGYFLSFFSRSANVVLVPFLQEDLGITAGDIGVMSGMYFAAFALAQIPLGIVSDRFDSARVNGMLLPFAFLGSLVFAYSSSLMGLAWGRALIGLGVAGCLMTAFRYFSLWMSLEKRAFYNGIVVASGGLGNMAAFYPVAFLVEDLGWTWQDVYKGLAVLFFVQCLLVLLVPPRKKPPRTTLSFSDQGKDYKEIVTHPRFLAVTPYACTVMAGFLSMQTLWFGPLLKEGYGVDEGTGLGLITATIFGMIAGNMVSGKVMVWVKKMGFDFLTFMNVTSCIHVLLLVSVVWGGWSLWPGVWFLMGILYSGIVQYYAYLGTFLSPRLLGRAMTLGNGLLFLMIFLIQVVYGYGVDVLKVYMSEGWAYRGMYIVLLCVYGLTFFWQVIFHRRYCRD
jgi:MFS family permease